MIKSLLPSMYALKYFKFMPKISAKSLIMVNKQNFGPKRVIRQENTGSIMIKNDNLKFQAENYELNFYPFHPEVIKKNANLYEINKFSFVAAFNFILKSSSTNDKYGEESKQNWHNRKSISLRFSQLAQLIDINPTQEKEWTISIIAGKQRQFKKVLTFKNLKSQRKYEIKLQQYAKKDKADVLQDTLTTKISHLNFQILQFLIKESLYDLSGMRLMFDIRRNEELAKICQKDKASIDREDLFKEYGNKDNIV